MNFARTCSADFVSNPYEYKHSRTAYVQCSRCVDICSSSTSCPKGVIKKKAKGKAAAKAKPADEKGEEAGGEDDEPAVALAFVEPMAPVAADEIRRVMRRRAKEGAERECLVNFVDKDI